MLAIVGSTVYSDANSLSLTGRVAIVLSVGTAISRLVMRDGQVRTRRRKWSMSKSPRAIGGATSGPGPASSTFGKEAGPGGGPRSQNSEG